MPLTNEQIDRAAELLEQIDQKGRELRNVLSTEEYHGACADAIGVAQQYASEGLGLDPEYFTPPAQMAANLRKLKS